MSERERSRASTECGSQGKANACASRVTGGYGSSRHSAPPAFRPRCEHTQCCAVCADVSCGFVSIRLRTRLTRQTEPIAQSEGPPRTLWPNRPSVALRPKHGGPHATADCSRWRSLVSSGRAHADTSRHRASSGTSPAPTRDEADLIKLWTPRDGQPLGFTALAHVSFVVLFVACCLVLVVNCSNG